MTASRRQSVSAYATSKLISGGRVTIPEDMRDALRWVEGTELVLVMEGNAVRVVDKKRTKLVMEVR